MGATDAESEGTWKWTDGTPWNFENWAPGQPNNYLGPQMFGAINFNGGVGPWNDDESSDPQPFFCQYDLGKCKQKNCFGSSKENSYFQVVLLAGHIFQTLLAATNTFLKQNPGLMPGVSASQWLKLMETLPPSLTRPPMSS